jgi:hypothetical protein
VEASQLRTSCCAVTNIQGPYTEPIICYGIRKWTVWQEAPSPGTSLGPISLTLLLKQEKQKAHNFFFLKDLQK